MSKISCEIIKDMLPLYYDDVCSGESKKMVEEHLNQCNSCKGELDKIRADIIIPKETVGKNRSDGNVIKNISNIFNRSKIKAFAIGLIFATTLFVVYLGLFRWNIISVPTDRVEITNVCELVGGQIAYHFKIKDGKDINECRYVREDGNLYISPYRPIIKMKANTDYPFIRGSYTSFYHDLTKYKALYYGTPKDNILMWKKGMDVPKASEKVQAEFNFGN